MSYKRDSSYSRELTDESKMPIGKYKGTRLIELDKGYAEWMLKQNWISDFSDLHAWLKANVSRLRKGVRGGGQLTDDSPMPFGKHKGEALSTVPASYFLWMLGQAWINEWPDLHAYIVAREDDLNERADQEQLAHEANRESHDTGWGDDDIPMGDY